MGVCSVADNREVRNLLRRARALEIAMRDGSLELIVSGVVMPRLGGIERARRMRAMRPDARVLFVSDQPERFGADEPPLPDRMTLLRKPFSLDPLRRSVRAALDA